MDIHRYLRPKNDVDGVALLTLTSEDTRKLITPIGIRVKLADLEKRGASGGSIVRVHAVDDLFYNDVKRHHNETTNVIFGVLAVNNSEY